MGKRQIAQLQPYELALTLVIAELAAGPMNDSGIPLLHGALPIIAIVVVNALISVAAYKSVRMHVILGGKASVVVRNGVVDEKEMNRALLTLDDLMEQVRIAGIPSITNVATGVMESNGVVSAFSVSQERPLAPKDIHVMTPPERVPLTLVIDGSVLTDNLKLISRNEAWLARELASVGVREPKRALFVIVDAQGTLIAQEKGADKLCFVDSALRDAKAVVW